MPSAMGTCLTANAAKGMVASPQPDHLTLLAWIKMLMEVRKTEGVVSKHHSAMLNHPKAVGIFPSAPALE